MDDFDPGFPEILNFQLFEFYGVDIWISHRAICGLMS